MGCRSWCHTELDAAEHTHTLLSTLALWAPDSIALTVYTTPLGQQLRAVGS